MIKSMTGYGRGDCLSGSRKVLIEIKTVNHRYLDINIKLMRSLIFLEDYIRNIVQQHISRGRVEVYVSYTNYEQTNKDVHVDLQLAKEYLAKLHLLSEKLSLKDDITNTYIASLPDVLILENGQEDDDELKQIFYICLNKALNQVIAMRQAEGQKLYNDLKKRCLIVSNFVDKIKERMYVVPQYYRQKLEERIKYLTDVNQLDDQRLEQEVAIIADRANIDEEITRLYSHIEQFNNTLECNEPVGKKLDFIVQEMNREINTIASKSNDVLISKHVVDAKSEISKIREQIQNIE